MSFGLSLSEPPWTSFYTGVPYEYTRKVEESELQFVKQVTDLQAIETDYDVDVHENMVTVTFPSRLAQSLSMRMEFIRNNRFDMTIVYLPGFPQECPQFQCSFREGFEFVWMQDVSSSYTTPRNAS